MEWDRQLMKTLHRPAQYLWFDVIEWFIFIIPFLFGLLGHSIIFLFLPLFPKIIFPYLRKKKRGYFSHFMVSMGISEINGYPPLVYAEYEE